MKNLTNHYGGGTTSFYSDPNGGGVHSMGGGAE